MLTIACVLKSGGDYDWEYVNRLRNNVDEHLTYEHEWAIFTDMWDMNEMPPEGVTIHCLQTDLKSYWSKLEIFRLFEEVIYFDLDTIILSDLNTLVEGIRTLCSFTKKKNNFFMMKSFSRHRNWASGIMAWTGDFQYLLTNCREDHMERYGKWEQDYIVDMLGANGVSQINLIDDCIGGGIVSYKHHCSKGIPQSANIICFHGKPRPREVGWLQEELCKTTK